MLFVKLEGQNAKVPSRGSIGSAGYYLYANVQMEIFPQNWGTVSTGIQLMIPEGYYGRIASRSSLVSQHGIIVGGGVIDQDYRGEVKVLLYNTGLHRFSIEVGDRVAQIILEKITMPEVQVVKSLGSSERGENGFGSTGK
ncbi:hypothetical protein L7F22_009572 [Adiantum nelumboides]|nr:hypothetical protein [Adiantum nelumboides]